jgi:hypothetical protein
MKSRENLIFFWTRQNIKFWCNWESYHTKEVIYSINAKSWFYKVEWWRITRNNRELLSITRLNKISNSLPRKQIQNRFATKGNLINYIIMINFITIWLFCESSRYVGARFFWHHCYCDYLEVNLPKGIELCSSRSFK